MLIKNKDHAWPLSVKLSILVFIGFVLWIFNSQYLTSLLLGLITASLTYPIYDFLEKKKQEQKLEIPSNITAIVTVLGISAILLFIVNQFVVQIIREAPSFVLRISEFMNALANNQEFLNELSKYNINPDFVNSLVKNLNVELQKLLLIFGYNTKTSGELYTLKPEDFENALRVGSQSLRNITNYLIATVIFILSWLNGLLEGGRWMRGIFDLLPFSQAEEAEIREDLKSGVQNVIYANILSGLVHATVCFVVMLAFGVPNLFILTVIIFLVGVLPLSPSEISYAIALLSIATRTQNYFLLFVFAILAELIILWVNYVLIPKIIASGRGGNSLLILTSILSGISIFGLMGFVIGPIIMILVQTLYRILISRLREENESEVKA